MPHFLRYQDKDNPFANLLSLGDAAKTWGLDDSTLRKAIKEGRLAAGIDAQKFGKQWVVTIPAMEREFNSIKLCREISQRMKYERESAQRLQSIENEHWPE